MCHCYSDGAISKAQGRTGTVGAAERAGSAAVDDEPVSRDPAVYP